MYDGNEMVQMEKWYDTGWNSKYNLHAILSQVWLSTDNAENKIKFAQYPYITVKVWSVFYSSQY
jgi:hypothetical protein